MKMRRGVSVNGDKERTAKGSQLTRVVPPSFSVPFICDGESKVRCFFNGRSPSAPKGACIMVCPLGRITVTGVASYSRRHFWQHITGS